MEKDNWMSRYNFFLLMKFLLPKFSDYIFKAFNRVLIECLIPIEEEIKILVNEIIEQLLDFY